MNALLRLTYFKFHTVSEMSNWKSYCHALTISPCDKELQNDITTWCNQKGMRWWSGCAEVNGKSGIRHVHLALGFTSARFRQSVHKSIMKFVKDSTLGVTGQLTLKGIALKPWYNDDWATKYAKGEWFGNDPATLPDDMQYLKKDECDFKKKIVRWHDVVCDLWDEHLGDDKVPQSHDDVKTFFSHIMYVTREIGVIERYKYQGRVVEIFEMLTKRNAPNLLASVNVNTVSTIKELTDTNNKYEEVPCLMRSCKEKTYNEELCKLCPCCKGSRVRRIKKRVESLSFSSPTGKRRVRKEKSLPLLSDELMNSPKKK